MKKFLFTSLVIVYAIICCVFTGCASTAIFGGEKVPDWIVAEPETDGEYIYAVGSGKHADKDMAYKMAKADANSNLSKKLNNSIQDTVQTSFSSDGKSSSKYEENATQKSESVLKNATIVEYYESIKKKTVYAYVLIRMPIETK